MAPDRSDRTILHVPFEAALSDQSAPSSAEIDSRRFVFQPKNERRQRLRSFGSESNLNDYVRRLKAEASIQCDLLSDGSNDCGTSDSDNDEGIDSLNELEYLRRRTDRVEQSTQTCHFNDPVFLETCDIVSEVIDHMVGKRRIFWGFSRKWTVIKNVVSTIDELLYRHEINMGNLARQFNLRDDFSFTTVVNEVIGNDITWSRVMTVMAFAGAIAVSSKRSGHPNHIEDLKASYGHCLSVHLASWIEAQGGWAAFMNWKNQQNGASDHFQSSVFNGLVMAAAGLGLLSIMSLYSTRAK